MVDYKGIIERVGDHVLTLSDEGKVASYIPELAKVNSDKFGAHLLTLDGEEYGFGDSNEKFSIQSIAKVLALSLAYKLQKEALWKRVGVEPSGTPFNSLFQLEHDQGIPRNPLINSGALVVSDVLVSRLANPKDDLLKFIQSISGNSTIEYNEVVAESEKSVGFRNAALINLMKSFGNIHNNIDEVLDFYYHLCSIEMTCKELAKTFLYLANDGVDKASSERIITETASKRINSIMQTCGFYDEAGEFSFNVGLPGKSGVGGGIMAVLPNKYSVAVWSPRLNKKGNSFKGMKFLEYLTTETGTSIF